MAKPLITTGAANAAQLSIASGVLFVLPWGSRHVLEPEFNATWRFVSEGDLGPFGLGNEPGERWRVAILSQARTVADMLVSWALVSLPSVS